MNIRLRIFELINKIPTFLIRFRYMYLFTKRSASMTNRFRIFELINRVPGEIGLQRIDIDLIKHECTIDFIYDFNAPLLFSFKFVGIKSLEWNPEPPEPNGVLPVDIVFALFGNEQGQEEMFIAATNFQLKLIYEKLYVESIV